MMDKRKKILFLITKSNWGGAQRYVHDLAANLPRERFDSAVAAGGGDGRLFDMLKKAGVRTIPIPGLGRDIRTVDELRTFREIFRIIKKERPDVVHLNSSKAGALGAIAAKAALLTNKFFLQPTTYNLQPIIVFTAHGWGFHEDRPLLARAAIFFASRFSSLFQDRIIVLDTADYAAAEKFIPRRKLALIPNGIGEIDFYARPDMSGRAAARAFLAQKIGRDIPDGAIVIGTIAELTKNKGLPYLVEAIRLLNLQPATCNLQAIIIGDGEEKETIQKQIDARGLAESVFLAGFIPDAGRFLKAFDAFVLPSLKEGLPYAVMEAMTADLPVIATNVGGMPDLVKNHQTGLLIPPEDFQKLSESLGYLMRHPEERTRLGENAASLIATKFRFSDMLERTITLYEARGQ